MVTNNKKKFDPQAAKNAQNDNMIKVTDHKLKNPMTRERAKDILFQSGKEIGKELAGFRHSGSVAIHFYYSELTDQPGFIVQQHLQDTREYTSALGYNKLFHQMKQSYESVNERTND